MVLLKLGLSFCLKHISLLSFTFHSLLVVCAHLPPPHPPPPLHHGPLKSSSSCPNMLPSATVGLSSGPPGGTGLTDGCDLHHFFSPRIFCSVYFISCHSPPALFGAPYSSSLSVPSGPDVWGYEVPSDPRPRALSVIAVRPELDMLYKQMREQHSGEGTERVCQERFS